MDPQMNGQGPPPAPVLSDGTNPVDPALVTNHLLNAIMQAAVNASSTHSGAEAKDYLDAALKGAQAVVVLDPGLSQGGTPLEHDVAMKALEGDTQQQIAHIQRQGAVEVEEQRGVNALAQARVTAAAPSPAKKLSIHRDAATGRMASIEQEG
jgi:hypothetical protein